MSKVALAITVHMFAGTHEWLYSQILGTHQTAQHDPPLHPFYI